MLSSALGLMTVRAELLEVLSEDALSRLAGDLRSALRRRPAQEPRLAGMVRVLVHHSAALREVAGTALDTMVKRRSFARPLYAATARALGEAGDPRSAQALSRALGTEDAGGLASVSAAGLASDPCLREPLAKLATSRHAHLAFGAELARVARHESSGAHVAAIAPKIKEAHRIALCLEVLVPLLWQRPIDAGITPALSVLRDAERHLGRWLVLAEIAVRAGDRLPLTQARERASSGPTSARAAWALVAWALEPEAGEPAVRPTVELVARLSDRPSADKDTTFLFRLATSGVAGARPMLENVARGSLLANEIAVRAALHLARDYREPRFREQLLDTARSSRREHLRGIAAAALFDLGERELALSLALELSKSRQLSALAWGALVQVAQSEAKPVPIVNERNFRRIQLGWVE
jgi:hypothetical protein